MSALGAMGMLLTVVGAALLYAGAANQQLLAKPHRWMLWGGWGALLFALPALGSFFGPATSAFVWLTLAMLVWSVLPLAIAWLRTRREGAR